MKKLAWLGLIVVVSSGCGRCWSSLFRGDRCAPPACGAPGLMGPLANGCAPCGAAGYAGYDSALSGVGGYYDSGVASGDYYNGQVIDGGYGGYSEGTVTNPPMSPIAPAPAS